MQVAVVTINIDTSTVQNHQVKQKRLRTSLQYSDNHPLNMPDRYLYRSTSRPLRSSHSHSPSHSERYTGDPKLEYGKVRLASKPKRKDSNINPAVPTFMSRLLAKSPYSSHATSSASRSSSRAERNEYRDYPRANTGRSFREMYERSPDAHKHKLKHNAEPGRSSSRASSSAQNAHYDPWGHDCDPYDNRYGERPFCGYPGR